MHESNTARALVVLTTAFVALVAGCMSPSSAFCSDGRICPPSTHCDVQRGICVGSPQETACAAYEPGHECNLAGAPGLCGLDGLCVPYVCGDGMITGAEACDGAKLNGKTCLDLKFYEAAGLKCGADCKFDTSACTGACGDDKINEATESCDGSDLGGADCRTAGFYDAPGLSCSPYCRLDVSRCSGFCGDGKMNGPEQCDGTPPLGKTCVDYGFARGRLGCSALCGPDLGGCGQVGWKTVLGGTFNGIWGAARDDIFAVGPKGKIVRGDGTTWSTMISGTMEELFRVWGSGPNDVFAVGAGSILHWNGTAWSPMRLPADVVPGLGPIWGDVWGSGPNDVYVVGFGGPLLHWDGATWSATPSAPDTWWSGIWGSGPKDVYVAGGAIRHWDGSRWSQTPAPGPDKIWGSGPRDVFACGSFTCTHWDGTRWTETAWVSGVIGQVSSIWGSGPKDVLAVVGKHLMHWDGASWSETSSPDSPHAIWGTGADDVFVAGGSGIQHMTGDSWRTTTVPIQLTSLWAGGPNDLFVGGWLDKFECADAGNSDCTPVVVPHFGQTFLPGFGEVANLWGSSPSDVFAITSEGDLHHWNGTSWAVSYEGPWGSFLGPSARSIWGSGPDSVFVLGGPLPGNPKADPSERPRVVRWDGRSWSPMLLPAATRFLSSLWASTQGDAFAVGETGEIVRWDGDVWSAMDSGSTEDLIDVWGSGPKDVYAVGAHGTVLHYDGATWSPMRSAAIPADSYLFSVRGSGRGDVFAVGGFAVDVSSSQHGGDVLLHLRQGDWERVALPPGAIIDELAVTPSRVFLGAGTEIVQLDRHATTCEGPEKSCGDGWDNDCDGVADGDDPDCTGKVAEQCANGFDDDRNGKVDCDDPACATVRACRGR